MKLKILFTAGRELEYVRNSILYKSFQKFAETILIIDNSKNFVIKYLKLLLKLLITKKNYDFVFVGFFGSIIMFLSPVLFRTKIIFDAFVFTYDTLCYDRKLCKPNSIFGKLIFQFDKISFKHAHHILVETQQNKIYLVDKYQIPKEKISTVYIGCDEEIFVDKNDSQVSNIILFYSTYQPLHGTDTIIKAASYIENDFDIKFHIYGNGMEFKKCKKLAEDLKLTNLFLFQPVAYSVLPKIISRSKICLGGPFGDTFKARRVITGKTYQFLFMKKPVIVTNTHANKELLTPMWDAEFCEINNPESLANSITKLLKNPNYCTQIANNGYKTYLEKASNILISTQIKNIVENL